MLRWRLKHDQMSTRTVSCHASCGYQKWWWVLLLRGWCMRVLSWFIRSFSRFTCLSSLWRLPGGESRTTFAPWRGSGHATLAARQSVGRKTELLRYVQFLTFFHFQLLEKAGPPMEHPHALPRGLFCEKKVVKVPTKILRVSVHSDISNTQPSTPGGLLPIWHSDF